MGIHLLELDSVIPPRQLYKLARKYAMTGGYELAISSQVTAEQLADLIHIYTGELNQYSAESSAYRASLAYRLLLGIKVHKNCTELLEQQLEDSILGEINVG